MRNNKEPSGDGRTGADSTAITRGWDGSDGRGRLPADAATDAHCARKAVGVDADGKERNLKRLRRIEGQVRGIQKMVDEERYCADVLTQISSVHEALRAVARELMRNHLKHCATRCDQGRR